MKAETLRNTPQRQLVRDIMRDNKTHPTADEVYEEARKIKPTISRGTVYRNLNVLVERGEITRLLMPLGPDHYDSEMRNHYHFLCRSCKKVLDTHLPYDNALNNVALSEGNCKTEWHKLLLIGLCSDCNK